MALESLQSPVCTIESEIWTFGVLLWELFTFAQNLPYEKEIPNFTFQALVSYLTGGGRLTPPDTAPHSMYILLYFALPSMVGGLFQTHTNAVDMVGSRKATTNL
jgi:hypothetical protein